MLFYKNGTVFEDKRSHGLPDSAVTESVENGSSGDNCIRPYTIHGFMQGRAVGGRNKSI